jgi:hypothetical protein
MLVLVFCSFCASAQQIIIGFVGQKRVGKDTAADYLVSKYNFEKYAMAAPMKDAIKIIFKLSDEQLYGNAKEIVDPRWGVTPRELMNFIGVDTLKIRLPAMYPQIGDIYIKHLNIIAKESPNTSFAICDLRFQNDVDAVRALGGIIVKINRSSLKNTDEHISETSVNNIKNIDYTINNDGSIADLHKEIERIMQVIEAQQS